jgi:hypothetical protein
MNLSLQNLKKEQINFIIAKILGLYPLGKLLCYKDPEGGDTVISYDQNLSKHSYCFENYVYIHNCSCETIDVESDLEKYNQKFFNHSIFCFLPIPDYFHPSFIIELIQNYKIHLSFKNNLWIAKVNNVTYIHENLNHAILLVIIQDYLQKNPLSLYDLF